MQSKPDRPYKYICPVVNHVTKFRCLFRLIDKSAKEVSKGLVEKVHSIFGLPTILHSNNGKEFKAIKASLLIWPGQCNTVNGNPGHWQSHGLAEQGKRTIELMISARETDSNKCHCLDGFLKYSVCLWYVYSQYVYINLL